MVLLSQPGPESANRGHNQAQVLVGKLTSIIAIWPDLNWDVCKTQIQIK